MRLFRKERKKRRKREKNNCIEEKTTTKTTSKTTENNINNNIKDHFTISLQLKHLKNVDFSEKEKVLQGIRTRFVEIRSGILRTLYYPLPITSDAGSQYRCGRVGNPHPHPRSPSANKYTQLVIQVSHMVSGTWCLAWSDQQKDWSESRALASKGRCPVGHMGEFPDIL